MKYHEERMGPRGVSVHQREPNGSILVPALHQRLDGGHVMHDRLRETFDKYSTVLVLFQIQPSLRIIA